MDLKNDNISFITTPAEAYEFGYKDTVYTYFPSIYRNLIPHFLRGFFERRGYLCFKQKVSSFKIIFYGEHEFLAELEKELQVTNLSIEVISYPYSRLQICGKKRVLGILDYLYKDSTPETRVAAKYKSNTNLSFLFIIL